jgi:hypothetical protein
MIERCVNPTCRTEFNLLNAGDHYAYDRRSADTEFFWLVLRAPTDTICI